MHPLLEALCCPDCPPGDDRLEWEGPEPAGACPRCGRRFSAQRGFLRMLPHRRAETRAEEEELGREQAQRDREAALYDRLAGLRLLSLLEIPATLGPLDLGAEDRVVEGGCGTGRLTLALLRRGTRVVAVDHSASSLRVLEAKLAPEHRDLVLLVQGDAARLPIRTGWATAAVSAQVLEHLPSDALRRRAIGELHRVLEPGGRVALSAYWHAPLLRPFLSKEGRHSGAIYFHRFAREELRALLSPPFAVERLSGRLVYVLLAHLRKPK